MGGDCQLTPTRYTMKHVIGIDVGGSKTLGLVMDESGAVTTRARAGGANPRSVGRDQAAVNLGDVLRQLLASGEISAVCIGAAGIGTESDQAFFEALAKSMIPNGTQLLLRHDAQIALRAGTSVRPAMVVIAGTGSLVYGERVDLSGVRAGGYGSIIGDSASAYGIGIRAIRHAARTLDGVEEPSALSRSVLDALNAETASDLVERVHVWPPDVGAIASLAGLVGDAQARGDPAAEHIVSGESEGLRREVTTIARAVRNQSELPVIVAGGAFEAVPKLVHAVRLAAQQTGPCSVVQLALEPAHGAALLALDSITA